MENVLVVDDTLENLKVVSNFLKEEGYKIALAMDGPSALQIVKENNISLILLDIMMPGMDGYEVCRKLKEVDNIKNIPVVFLTARNDLAGIVQGFHAGGVDYITKPFNKDELLIRIKNHLDLYRSKQKLIEMNNTRDKLYSIIAHDIRSPLASIKLTIEILEEGLIDPGSSEFSNLINELKNTTEATYQLLNDLLAWSRVQKEALQLDIKHINITAILLDCISLLAGNAKNKNIDIVNQLGNDVGAKADELSIHTVFRNILSNAIKFTPKAGKIFINSKHENNNTIISFKDTGVGIPAETLEKIISSKELVTTSGTDKETGTGLGLLMVKSFIEKNNGKLIIESEINKGTEIILYIPN